MIVIISSHVFIPAQVLLRYYDETAYYSSSSALRITAGLITFHNLPVFQTSKRIPVAELPEIGGSRQSRTRKATVVGYLILIIQEAS